jgi:hypothetical protein
MDIHKAMKFYRTCQECGYVQVDRPPPGYPHPKQDRAYWKWAEKPCEKCKSEALDYGSERNPED